ncbi:MAG: hypothetical protein R3288_01605 [Woeseiaceae bacterium]|nr:hypothetical protein [Woeseiaceae bacterium]
MRRPWNLAVAGSLLLTCAAALAEEPAAEPVPAATLSAPTAEEFIDQLEYRFSWQLDELDEDLLDIGTDSSSAMHPFRHIAFEEQTLLVRLGKLRGLSFLTVAEFEGSHLYIGVSDDGLVGLHFKNLSR